VGIPLKVFLFRAVQELLFNVVKHAGVKNARIAIARSNGNLDITVSDEGIGLDPEILNSLSPKRGIGLLTLRERARYIGGSLTIEGVPGQGSRCTLTIPISLHKSEELKSPAVGLQPPARELPSSSVGVERLRVLFADDHQVLRNALIRLMDNQHGIQVVGQASNGREALEKVRQLKPEVVVMDVSMPEMDGIEATRRIKAELPDVRVIGLSMHEDEQIAQLMRQAGAESYLTKTAPADTLLNAIYGRR
jgi:CheY-like chemotaxis protein